MIRKSIKRTIREHFFVNPSDRLRVRQMEKKLGLPLPSVIRYCRELKKEGMLKTVVTGGVTFYTADRADGRFLLEKRLYNIGQLYKTGLVEHVRKELHNPVMIVFGSYERGEDIEGSDIDLYVQTPSKKRIDLGRYERMLGRKIQLFVHKGPDEIRNKHLANNILNGTVLNGFLEVFR